MMPHGTDGAMIWCGGSRDAIAHEDATLVVVRIVVRIGANDAFWWNVSAFYSKRRFFSVSLHPSQTVVSFLHKLN